MDNNKDAYTSTGSHNLHGYYKIIPKSEWESVIPTYHTTHTKDKKPEEDVKNKKLRVKLICVFPKWKYLVAKTTVEDYHSLFGGVVDQINPKNHFMSILNTLEKEFNEETSGTIHINFQKRNFGYQKSKYADNGTSELEEIPFTYIGTFYENDTFFIVIYIPKISNDVFEVWNKMIHHSQETLMKKLFYGWKIELPKLFEINRIYHKRLMKIKTNYQNIPKPVFTFMCSKLSEYHHWFEKEGLVVLDEDSFFEKSLIWEWNTMNSSIIKTKVHDLFEKIGVSVIN
jgi:hypothetical protein